jgi:hypothetical protein
MAHSSFLQGLEREKTFQQQQQLFPRQTALPQPSAANNPMDSKQRTAYIFLFFSDKTKGDSRLPTCLLMIIGPQKKESQKKRGAAPWGAAPLSITAHRKKQNS